MSPKLIFLMVKKAIIMEERNMTILAIGNAGVNIIDTICRKAEDTDFKAAMYGYADCDERDLHKHNTDISQSILLNYDNEAFPAEIFDGINSLLCPA